MMNASFNRLNASFSLLGRQKKGEDDDRNGRNGRNSLNGDQEDDILHNSGRSNRAGRNRSSLRQSGVLQFHESVANNIFDIAEQEILGGGDPREGSRRGRRTLGTGEDLFHHSSFHRPSGNGMRLQNGGGDDDDDRSSNKSCVSFAAQSDHSHFSDDDMGSEGDEDDTIFANGNGTVASGKSSGNAASSLGRRETAAISYLRSFLWIIFFVCTIVLTTLAYTVPRQREIERFEDAFHEASENLQSTIQATARQRFTTTQLFHESIQHEATLSDADYFTIQDLQRRGDNFIESTHMYTAFLLPLVATNQTDAWETYVQQNLHRQDLIATTTTAASTATIVPFIYEFDTLNAVPATETTNIADAPSFLPIWQQIPNIPAPPINYNILAETSFASVLRKNNNLPFLSRLWTNERSRMLQSFASTHQRLANFTYSEDEPITDYHMPIHDTTTNRLLAIFTCSFYWKSMLAVVHDDFIIVVSNNCLQTAQQSMSYQRRDGELLFLGMQDMHDSQFDKYVNTTTDRIHIQGTSPSNSDTTRTGCSYSILIYPTTQYHDTFITNEPIYFAVCMAIALLLTSLIFYGYTQMIERRQRIVMDEAIASSAIVSSLFPKTVRDRLVVSTKGGDKSNAMAGTSSPSIVPPLLQGEKYLKLGGNDDSSKKKKSSDSTEEDDAKTRPIADTFENTTVLFADIAGFTSWCASHDPSDVFLLLETLYGEFDKIARKRDVFKVETIGDCYVAVTGLPEPQEDHAIIMSLFAHECMRTMKLLLTKELRTLLGGDPSIISMRFGLHSGSVIAGVLRGEKSRFQLFGDTVNMAARIEHTGKRDRIHISPTTGELLIEAGKKKWLVERSDSPEDMQTYWLRPRSKTSAMDDARRSRASLSTDGGGTSISDAYSLSSGMSFGGMDGVSSHSRAWPEASTHSKAWIDSDSGDGFTMEGDMSDGGDSFA